MAEAGKVGLSGADREATVVSPTSHPNPGECRARRHLAVLDQMHADVLAAHQALKDNRIGDFRDHILRLADSVATLQQWQSEAAVATHPYLHAGNTGLVSEIQIVAAHRQIAKANYRLAALLRRCGRTASLLARHHRVTFGGAGLGEPAGYNLRSWSSEV